MHITRLHIDGFRRLVNFDITFNDTLNIIVGDNETGKSTVLEAIALVLSRQYDGRTIDHSVDPYIFNAASVARYFEGLRAGKHCDPPNVVIEAYLKDEPTNPSLTKLKGTNNLRSENCPGITLTIEVSSDHLELLKDYAREDSNPVLIPVEFYKVTWRSFSNKSITSRDLPFRAAVIDTTLARTHRGPNRYVAQLITSILTDTQRRELSIAYKRLHHQFGKEGAVASINSHLAQQDMPTSKKNLSVQMDLSSRTSWDSSITAHVNDLPFDCAGKGEQCRIQMRLAISDAEKSQIILIEEPESHLAHANLNALMNEIRDDCAGRQVIVTTHSAFVLNKLGLDNLRLMSSQGRVTSIAALTKETINYFKKLPGYDTLRLVLCHKCILVEGASDELIVKRAYQEKHGKLPIEDGVDVISVGLAFKRFLEIASLLKLNVRVVIDNDGDIAAVKSKFKEYEEAKDSQIAICYDRDPALHTLEPQLLGANSRQLLNSIFNRVYEDDESLLQFMEQNKTECALMMLESPISWVVPRYIANAVE